MRWQTTRRGVVLALILILALASACSFGNLAQKPGNRPGKDHIATGLKTIFNWNTLKENNPRLTDSEYRDLGEDAALHLRVFGRSDVPNVQILINRHDQVLGVRAWISAASGWKPWYDQAQGQPVAGPASPQTLRAGQAGQQGQTSGSANTRAGQKSSVDQVAGNLTGNVTVAPQGSVSVGNSTAKATGNTTGGVATNTSAGAAGNTTGNTTGNRSGAASGAERGQNITLNVASQWYTETMLFVSPADIGNGSNTVNAASALDNFTTLKAVDPKLASVQRLTEFIPMFGYHWGHKGPGLTLLVDRNDRVVGVEGVFTTERGWQPFYDQLPGHQDVETATGGRAYTEHVFFVDPRTIR